MTLPTYTVRKRKDRDNQWYAYFRVPDKTGKLKQKQMLVPDSVKMSWNKAYEAAKGPVGDFCESTLPKLPLTGDKAVGGSVEVEFQRWLRLKYSFRKENTVTALKNECGVFFRHLNVEYLRDVTREKANTAVESILGTKPAARYWRNILTGTKAFFKWATAEGLIGVNPVEHLTPPSSDTFHKVEEVWTDEEVVKTAARLVPKDRDCLLVLRYTGMYTSDLYEFRKKHVVKDTEEGYKILKRRAKAKYATEVINQPLLPQVEQIVVAAYNAATDPEDRLFVQSKSTPRVWGIMFKDRVGTAWRKAFPGKPEKMLKSLRHSFATWLMENDIPIDVAKKWMGHSANSNTLNAVYLHRQSAVKYAKRLVGL